MQLDSLTSQGCGKVGEEEQVMRDSNGKQKVKAWAVRNNFSLSRPVVLDVCLIIVP
jgi:hypothetical protein